MDPHVEAFKPPFCRGLWHGQFPKAILDQLRLFCSMRTVTQVKSTLVISELFDQVER